MQNPSSPSSRPPPPSPPPPSHTPPPLPPSLSTSSASFHPPSPPILPNPCTDYPSWRVAMSAILAACSAERIASGAESRPHCPQALENYMIRCMTVVTLVAESLPMDEGNGGRNDKDTGGLDQERVRLAVKNRDLRGLIEAVDAAFGMRRWQGNEDGKEQGKCVEASTDAVLGMHARPPQPETQSQPQSRGHRHEMHEWKPPCSLLLPRRDVFTGGVVEGIGQAVPRSPVAWGVLV